MYNDFEKKGYRVLLGICESGLSHANLFFSLHFIVLPFSIRHLDISHNTPSLPLSLPPPPPPILRSLCFQLSWVLQLSQGKLKTLLMQNLRGKQSVLREMCKWRIMLFDLPEPHSCCLLQIACPHYPGNQYTVYKILLQLIRKRMFIFSFKSPSPQMTSAVPREKTDHLSRQESLTMESLILAHPPAFSPHHPLDFK